MLWAVVSQSDKRMRKSTQSACGIASQNMAAMTSKCCWEIVMVYCRGGKR